jgi:hypothetical protein
MNILCDDRPARKSSSHVAIVRGICNEILTGAFRTSSQAVCVMGIMAALTPKRCSTTLGNAQAIQGVVLHTWFQRIRWFISMAHCSYLHFARPLGQRPNLGMESDGDSDGSARGDGIEVAVLPGPTAMSGGEEGPPARRDRHLRTVAEQRRSLVWRGAIDDDRRCLPKKDMARYQALIGPRLPSARRCQTGRRLPPPWISPAANDLSLRNPEKRVRPIPARENR